MRTSCRASPAPSRACSTSSSGSGRTFHARCVASLSLAPPCALSSAPRADEAVELAHRPSPRPRPSRPRSRRASSRCTASARSCPPSRRTSPRPRPRPPPPPPPPLQPHPHPHPRPPTSRRFRTAPTPSACARWGPSWHASRARSSTTCCRARPASSSGCVASSRSLSFPLPLSFRAERAHALTLRTHRPPARAQALNDAQSPDLRRAALLALVSAHRSLGGPDAAARLEHLVGGLEDDQKSLLAYYAAKRGV